jgi:EamA domain-containing membrane protein RarD
MGDDSTFRIALLIGMLVFMPIAIYRRVRSQATGEKLDRRQEGYFILLTLRPLGIATMVGVIAFVISPRSMEWSSVSLPAWLRPIRFSGC